jgi:hypothetical protein
MKSLKRAASVLAAVVGFGGLASIAFVACTDDPAAPSTDGGAADSTTDAAIDQQTDAPRADADAGTDAADTSPPDAADGSNALLQGFPARITAAYCQHLASCCVTFDAGTFDQARCEQIIIGAGGYLQMNIAANEGALDSGHVTYNAGAAANCLTDIAALDCTSDPSAHWTKTRGDCWAAVNGASDGGAACTSSFECAPGNYCKGVGADDGGKGACSALEEAGASCGSNFACTYQQNGLAPPLWCDPAAGSTCVAQKALNETCTQDLQCASGICIQTCLAGATGPSAGLCNVLAVPKDAGTD